MSSFEMNIAVHQNHRRRVYHHHQHHHHRHHHQARVSAGDGGYTPARNACIRELPTTQQEQCRFLRCTECCFCGGQCSEVPVQQEPEPDSNGSEAEQHMDKHAGWDEGTCRQCGACYLRSSVRPVICQCGAEVCGYSLRCLVAHTKSCAAQTTPQAACE